MLELVRFHSDQLSKPEVIQHWAGGWRRRLLALAKVSSCLHSGCECQDSPLWLRSLQCSLEGSSSEGEALAGQVGLQPFYFVEVKSAGLFHALSYFLVASQMELEVLMVLCKGKRGSPWKTDLDGSSGPDTCP